MLDCELCTPAYVVAENTSAYARYDSSSLAPGHVIVVPRRLVQERHSPDAFNIGVNVGQVAGQSRMHVHVHLIPRYKGDVPDPAGGVRCVLKR